MKAKECPIRQGDQVLFKRDVIRKDISPWDPDPFTVDLIKGSMITVSRSYPRPQCVTRNSSCFKLHRGPDVIEQLENIVDSKPSEPPVVEQEVQLSNEQPEVEVGEPQLEVQRSKDENQRQRNKLGRPTKQEAEKRRLAHQFMLQVKREANPPVRSSARLAAKMTGDRISFLERGGEILCRADTNKAHRVTGQIQVNHSICAAGGFAE